MELAGTAGGVTGEERYRAVIAPFRLGWLQDEVKRGQYEESLVLFDRLVADDPHDADVLFARGEVRRLRGDGTDGERALVDLGAAAQMPAARADVFRSLGLLYRQRNDPAAAQQAFQRYLAQAPQAPDAPMVRSYLTEWKR
jgi:tetratricopeptide (TPR) repeat protein